MRQFFLAGTVVLLAVSLSACGSSPRDDVAATAAAIDGKHSVPAGTPQAKTEKLGEWAEKHEVAMVARAVEDPAKASTETYEPTPGTRLVAVEFELGCLAGAHQFGPQLTKLVDSRGKTYDRVPRAMADHEDMAVTNLHAGERIRGWLAFEVPEGAEPASLVYGFTGYVTVDTLQVGLSE
jgi:hypothetical protein